MPTRSAAADGRELDAAEVGRDGFGEALDGQRLSQPGYAFQQHVSVAEEADQQLVDHAGLADNDLAQFHAQEVDKLTRFADAFVQGAMSGAAEVLPAASGVSTGVSTGAMSGVISGVDSGP